MSVVKEMLHSAIDARLEQNRLISQEAGSISIRILELTKDADKNNSDLEELLDALELEIDHLERVAA